MHELLIASDHIMGKPGKTYQEQLVSDYFRAPSRAAAAVSDAVTGS